MICVDASVAAKWLFAEEHSNKAGALLQQTLEDSERIVVPRLLLSEVTNIIRQRMRTGGLSLEDAHNRLARLLATPLSFQDPRAVYAEALTVAATHNLPAAYDAQYIALSNRLGAHLWTDDQRLLRLLAGKLPYVSWIGNYHGETKG